MSSQRNTSQEIFGAFFKFFEWAYDIRFRPDHKEQIKDEILRGWSSTDNSDKELLIYIIEIHDLVFGRGKSQHVRLKPQAHGLLKAIFSLSETNNRARILDTMHRIIEDIRPGVTQVPIRPRPTLPLSTSPPIPPQQTVPSPTPNPISFTPPSAVPNTPQATPDPNDYQQQMLEMQREQQKATIESNIARIRHEMNMHIISNIR